MHCTHSSLQSHGAGTFAEFCKPLATWRNSAKVPAPTVDSYWSIQCTLQKPTASRTAPQSTMTTDFRVKRWRKSTENAFIWWQSNCLLNFSTARVNTSRKQMCLRHSWDYVYTRNCAIYVRSIMDIMHASLRFMLEMNQKREFLTICVPHRRQSGSTSIHRL